MSLELIKEEFETANLARKALITIEENREKNMNLQRMFETTLSSGLLAQAMSEPFEAEIFESKIKSDLSYFNYFSDKMDNTVCETMNQMLKEYFKTIGMIYEVVNIKPEIFGKDLSNNISIEEKDETVKLTLENFLNKHYYSYPPEKRIEIYESEVINHVKDIISSQTVEINEATEYAIKWIILENFLHKLAFPGLIERKIKYVIESEDYGKVFDQARVQELYEQFCDQAKAISKVLAIFI